MGENASRKRVRAASPQLIYLLPAFKDVSRILKASERELAAIMFTDIIGYTVLAQKDEPLAMSLLFEHNSLLRPVFPKHGGREVKTTGDSFLVEFSSAVEAVDCAIEIQSKLHERNQRVSDERRIEMRAGIHVGDVVRSDGDIFGDVVNVCSRILSTARAGGICMSEQVFKIVRNKAAYPLEKMERQWLKNIALPVDVYRVVLPWGEERGTEYALLSKYRIAVLPFTNLSPDPNDEYFADGMTEELITALSGVKQLSVIARTSVMLYKNLPKKASDIARELSAGTLVEGSVRKAGNKVRLAVQLIDGQNEGHLWARNYDKELGDIFSIQTDIAKRITRALKVRLLSGEERRIEKRATSPEAYTLFLKGMHFRNQASEEGWRRASEFFQRATTIEPTYPEAVAAKSICLDWLAYFAFEQPSEAYAKAKELALEALELNERTAEAHLSLFFISFYHEGNWTESEAQIRRALDLSPSSVEAHNNYAFFLANFGRTEEAILEAERALELDPLSVMSQLITADVYAWAGRHTEALSKFRGALDMNPALPLAHNDLGAAYLSMGRIEDGVKELEKAVKLSGGSPIFEANLGYAYGVSGRREEAVQTIGRLKEALSKGQLPSYFLAVAYAGLGEKEEALSWLERAYEEHTVVFVPLLNVEPCLSNLRQEPRFKSILAKMGLPT